MPAHRVSTAFTGVAAPSFRAPRPEAAGDSLRVVFVGTWIERKGIGELCEAWAGVCRHYPDPHLTVVGTVGASGEQALRDFPADCRDRVTVVPHVEPGDLPGPLGLQDLFGLPRRSRGRLVEARGGRGRTRCVVGGTFGVPYSSRAMIRRPTAACSYPSMILRPRFRDRAFHRRAHALRDLRGTGP